MSDKNIELVKGTVFELDVSKKYLIIFDKRHITQDDLHTLLKGLGKQGFEGLGLMINGDPSTVKIVEKDA